MTIISRSEAFVLRFNDVFFDLLNRRPQVAAQLAEEADALAARYAEEHSIRRLRPADRPQRAAATLQKEERNHA